MMCCLKAPKDSPWVVAHRRATKNYALNEEKLKQQGMSGESIKERLGPPGVHGWNALVQHYCSLGSRSLVVSIGV